MGSTESLGVDLNDPTTLELYNQVLLFKNSVFEDKLLFPAPDKARQRTLQALAHKLDLECEYSVAKRTLRITRPVAEDFSDPIIEYNRFINLDLPESGGGALEAFINEDGEGADEALPGDFPLGMSQAEIDLPLYNFSDDIIPINDKHLGPWSTGLGIAFCHSGGDTQHQQSISNPLATARSGIIQFQESCILEQGPFHEHIMHGHEHDETVAEDHGFFHNSKSSIELGSFVQNAAQPASSSIATRSPDHADAAFITGRASRKRKNKERSVSPAYNGTHVTGLSYHAHCSAGESTSAYNMRSSSSEEQQTFHRDFEGAPHPSSQSQAQRYNVESTHEFTPNPGRALDVTFRPRKRLVKAPIPDYARSRSSSISSQQSELGQSVFMNVFSRRPSVQGAETSPYQEVVFDSRVTYSESQASVHSNNSYASGRRGPLSELAKAGMNAVRKIGACWRCKFLRKPCNSETPCAFCPKPTDRPTNWGTVGCQRGTFESTMHPIVLCPNSSAQSDSTQDLKLQREVLVPQNQDLSTSCSTLINVDAVEGQKKAVHWVNQLSKAAIHRRRDGLEQTGRSVISEPGDVSVHPNPSVRQLFRTCFPGSIFSTLVRECSPSCVPLNECVLAIAWESINFPLIIASFSDMHVIESLGKLLPRAAAYQAKYQEDQLIAQSLVCLRNCLEVMRLQAYVLPASIPHDLCSASSCQVECIAQLSENLSLYLEELSRVFFIKENMRNKAPWWLSTFYSFCIQSFVKKVLWEVTAVPNSESLAYQEYLQLPLSLFIASSGFHDPLSGLYNFGGLRGGTKGPSTWDYTEARIAVNQSEWVAAGVKGSADYLKRLFADPLEDAQTKLNALSVDKNCLDQSWIDSGLQNRAESIAFSETEAAASLALETLRNYLNNPRVERGHSG